MENLLCFVYWKVYYLTNVRQAIVVLLGRGYPVIPVLIDASNFYIGT